MYLIWDQIVPVACFPESMALAKQGDQYTRATQPSGVKSHRNSCLRKTFLAGLPLLSVRFFPFCNSRRVALTCAPSRFAANFYGSYCLWPAMSGVECFGMPWSDCTMQATAPKPSGFKSKIINQKFFPTPYSLLSLLRLPVACCLWPMACVVAVTCHL